MSGIKMRKLSLVFLLFVAVSCLFILHGRQDDGIFSAQASDFKNFQSPIFQGVKRAYIYVDYVSDIEEQDLMPEMRRENIEKMMLDLYKKRFSPTECRPIIMYKNPYSCDNQPVTLVPIEEASNFVLGRDTSFATKEELSDPGTLIAILRISIMGNSERIHNPPLQAPLLNYQNIQDRPGISNIPLIHRVPFASAIPLDQTFKFYKGEPYALDSFAFGINVAVGR